MTHEKIHGNFYKLLILLQILVNTVFAEVVQADALCQPTVKPAAEGMTLVKFLKELSLTYDFQLSVPENFDRPVNVPQSMELEALIKMLTTGMSTIIMHSDLAGCPKPRITSLSIISAGEDTEFLSEGFPVDTLTKIPEPEPPESEPLVIEDMELYVTEVLLKKRKALKKRMSQEQLSEFNIIKKRLIFELKDEIK